MVSGGGAKPPDTSGGIPSMRPETKFYPISTDNRRATRQTLDIMRAAVQNAIREPEFVFWARSLVYACAQGDQASEASTLADFVGSIKFQADPFDLETIIDPLEMMRLYKNGIPLSGDCDCKSTLLCALMTAVGIESKFRAVGNGGNGQDYDHVLVTARVNGEWSDYDPSTTSEFVLPVRPRGDGMMGDIRGISLGQRSSGNTSLSELGEGFDLTGIFTSFGDDLQNIKSGKRMPAWYAALYNLWGIDKKAGLIQQWSDFSIGMKSFLTWALVAVAAYAAYSYGKKGKR